MADPAALFAALGEPTRLSLVMRLAGGARLSIAALSSDAAISRQAVTRHLRVLEAAGVVTARKVGRETCFELRADSIAQARDYLGEVAANWDAALARLKGFVER